MADIAPGSVGGSAKTEHSFSPASILGTDPKEAERRYHRIQQLYDEQCAKNGWKVWAENAFLYAQELAAGEKTIKILPNEDAPGVQYARTIDRQQDWYPSVPIAPADPAAHAESVKSNQDFVAQRLKELEQEMRELGALGSQEMPTTLVSGSFYEALDAYADHIRASGDRLENGDLKPYQRLRLHRVERFKREHEDVPLAVLNYDKCAGLVAYWRNRPVTLWKTRSSKDNARHHLGELFRFFEWLDVTPKFAWTLPRGVSPSPARSPSLESEKKLSAVTKQTYTVEQLAVLNKHATPLERMALYLGLNCAMGAAELGRLVIDDFLLDRPHQFAEKLEFASTPDDSFLCYFRPKTEVFGEWLLWTGTVPMVRWAIDRSKRLKTKTLFVWETGKPIYDESMTNAQMGFANLWERLIKRVRKSEAEFPGSRSGACVTHSPT